MLKFYRLWRDIYALLSLREATVLPLLLHRICKERLPCGFDRTNTELYSTRRIVYQTLTSSLTIGIVGALGIAVMAIPQQKPASTKEQPGRAATARALPLTAQESEFFEKRIRPALVQNCYSCHSGKNRQGGLSLDTRAGWQQGGKSGKAILPGQPNQSLLLQTLRHQHPRLKMPPTGKLPPAVIADFEKWVRMGAPDPRTAQPAKASATTSWSDVIAIRKKWWSLQPLRVTPPPHVKQARSSAHPVDRFLQAQREAKGLAPAAPADRRTLARRAALLLTGLPPDPKRLDAFLQDTSPGAFAKWVDTLLASPHFGEQWARHWMDVVRYGETHGYEWNYELRDPWRYRDYLIRAFNQDVPYNQFVREHIAGDLLTNPRINRSENLNESVIGTAFYRFGEVGHDNFREIGYDVVDNQIDTFSKAFQATTIACARCHDHKLDAISSRDYYALFGVFTSARQVIHTLDTPDANRKIKQVLLARKREIRAELARIWQAQSMEIPRFLRAAQLQIAHAPDAAQAAAGLDAEKLKAWVAALNGSAALEEPLSPWLTLAKTPAPTATVWENLRAQSQKERTERRAYNAERFVPFGDFRGTRNASAENGGDPMKTWQGWGSEGLGLEEGCVPAGEFAILPDGDRVLTAIYPAGLYTHLLSERLNGSLRSPILPKEKRFLSVEVMGGKSAQARSIPDFRQLGETPYNIDRARPGWMRIGKSDRDEKVYVDIVTRADNIRNPYRSDDTNPAEQRSFFGVTRAYLHDGDENPKDELLHLTALFGLPAPQSPDEAARRCAEILQKAIQSWAAENASDADARWLDALIRHGLFRVDINASSRLKDLVMQYREAEKQIHAPRVVVGMADVGNGYDFPVFVRGDFNTHGEIAPRRYLEALCKPGERFIGGSGRLALAEKIASPANPLTARVMVNRIWHHLFGEGLVRTVDDFGHLGEKPSHPELLDYLAAQFIRENWSVKRLIRSLVLTQAFQMSALPSAKATQIDPMNRLLQHFPARRLTAEAIRDSILAVSGRLDRTLYGPSIDPHREKPTPERRLFSGPLDGNGRRSIYTRITLMEGPAFLCAFNFPDPKAAQGRRDITNVPTQALTLLNDPFVVSQAEFWAKRIVTEPDADLPARMTRLFLTAFGRPPTRPETEQFTRLVAELRALHNAPENETMTHVAIWKDVAHTLFNLKEFIYVR
jgi:hypothetical protein